MTRMTRVCLYIFCFAVAVVPIFCDSKALNGHEKAGLPEFLSELDLESLEASKEDVEALKNIVKRLTSDNNGEYQVYQVFFGNEDLLREWLMGADVSGQPGVDYPALTTIPVTSFSCRGLKGGYYADLETNCQVFHICDNGRKISFLCPNGTIFQQSQLICDWWFKVDCSKSTELYEQSAEQLAEEEKRRAEFKKINSEFHRDKENRLTSFNNVDNNVQQNGRSNHFSQSQNQMHAHEQNVKFNNQNNFNNQNTIARQISNTNKKEYSVSSTNTHKTNVRHQNYLVNDRNEATPPLYDNNINNKLLSELKTFHKKDGKYLNLVNNDQANDYHKLDLNDLINGRKNNKNSVRQSKERTFTRDNFNSQNQKVTPSYTETTTFRTSTSNPVKEFQQLAESASFTSRQNMRYNKGFNLNQSITHLTNKYKTLDGSVKPTAEENLTQTTTRTTVPSFSGSTFRPRIISTTPESITTLGSFSNMNYYKQSTEDDKTISTPLEYVTGSTNSQDFYQRNNGNSNYFSTDYRTNNPIQNLFDKTTTSTIITKSYDNNNILDNRLSNKKLNASLLNQAENNGVSNNNVDKPIANFYNQNYNKASIAAKERKNNQDYITNYYNQRIFTKNPTRNAEGNDYNIMSTSTEKSVRNRQETLNKQQTTRSSTARSYVPFTKNYAFSSETTATTRKPLAYTATVPNYSNKKNNQSKNKPFTTSVLSSYSSVVTSNKATYLPKKTTIPFLYTTENSILNDRPKNEKEHALNMLISLKGLKGTAPTAVSIKEESRRGLNIPNSSGPSALHSLALYFATAANDSNNILSNRSQNQKNNVISLIPFDNKTSAELPTSILTQHTINSYTELFNLNNALENNFTNFDENGEELTDEDSGDLELQQSAGPLNGIKKSNNTKLRELAQVFTQALSAYLQDPDTFKRVLTEIRPTEPSQNTEKIDVTTNNPPTTEEYPSVTKEKGEVLDFSDDINAAKKRQPNKVYSDNIPRTYDSATDYHATRAIFEPQYLNSTPNSNKYDYTEILQNEKSNDFAYNVNNAFNEDSNLKNSPIVTDDSYFPSGLNSFKYNDTEPYGKYVKPYDATPISDNYVVSSTPATYGITESMVSLENQMVDDVNKNLLPLTNQYVKNVPTTTLYDDGLTSINPTTYIQEKYVEATTSKPFRIQFSETTRSNEDESLATANSLYSNHRNNQNNIIDESKQEQTNDHWTFSPSVTQLWESTVFVDPQHINTGLIDGKVTFTSTSHLNFANSSDNDNSREKDLLIRKEAPSRNFNSNNTTQWQWKLNNDDSPTAFTLLPSVYAEDQPVTTTPSYTTYIATTIEAQMTPKNNDDSKKSFSHSPSTFEVYNVSENEIMKAQKMFGNLNESSSKTLMQVMEQADKNVTIRQLVLLLINHCNGPMNKTMEEEKEHLLNALLRLPVNEFSSHESKEIIAGIRKISLPIGKTTITPEKYQTTVPSVPMVTTYRNRKERRYKTSTEKPYTSSRKTEEFTSESKNSVLIHGATVTDNRALELLRSLYSLAAKWG